MYYNYNPADKENRFTMAWMGILTIAILWTCLDAPLTFVLDINIKEHHLWWDGLFCLVFIIDIFLRITDKLKLPENATDAHAFRLKGKDKKPYHKTLWLPIDILTSLPIDIIVSLLGFSLPGQALSVIRLFRAVRIVKLRSVWNIIDFLPKAIKLGFIALAVVVTIHWIACGWMLLTPRTTADDITFYNISLYWAVTTLTTVGYGDITPNNNFARMYTMGVMLVGVGVYGVIIGNISRMMMLADKYTEERKEKLNGLHQYLKHYNIPASLQRQVFSFYNHLLNKNFTHEDGKIINDLPQALQNELNIYTKIKLIKNVHIFKECSTPCLKMIAQRLEQTFHSPNEYIIRKGDHGEEMFIIGHGEVQVISGENILAELKEGQFFGETALIEDTIRNADVQSKAYCDLYTFKKEDFVEVIVKYPHLGEKFNEIYRKRSKDRVKEESVKEVA